VGWLCIAGLPLEMMPMGWRTQDAHDYDGDNEQRRHPPPWRQRYDWPMILAVSAWLAGVAFCAWAGARMWRM
jgi:hypothetical protein